MQTVKGQDNEGLLSMQVLWEHFLRRWYLIVGVLIVSIVFSLVGTKLFTTPQYKSTSKLYIFNVESQSTNTAELSFSTYFAKDYAVLISDRVVLGEVIDNLDLDISYGALRNMVSVEGVEDTRWLEINVTTNDPKLSKRIADNICVVSQEKIVDMMGVNRVNIMGEATLSSRPTRSVFQTGLAYGLVIGLLLSCIILVFFALTDDKIKGVQDVERYLGISVLGTIPFSQPRAKAASTVGKNSAR